jgi:hypothetical protein
MTPWGAAPAEALRGGRIEALGRRRGAPVTSLGDLSDALQQLVARVSPAVLGVEQGRGAGTGVVFAADGYLLTNHHVAGSGRNLRVRLADGGLDGADTDVALEVDGGMRLFSDPGCRDEALAVRLVRAAPEIADPIGSLWGGGVGEQRQSRCR